MKLKRKIFMNRNLFTHFCLIVCFAVFAAMPAINLAASEDAIDVVPVQDDSGYQFYIENQTVNALQVRVTVELNNMAADVGFPYIATVSGNSKIKAFHVHPKDTKKSSGYRFQYKWRKVRFESKTCTENIFCIKTELIDDIMHFYVENYQKIPIAVVFRPKVFRNLGANVSFPLAKNCPAGKKTSLFKARLIDKWDGWDQTFSYGWQYGIINAHPQKDYAYALPYKRGSSHTMIQGFNGKFSHQGKYALDFEMPVGTLICAARGGQVVSVEKKYNIGGQTGDLKKKANHIEILHNDGTIGRYAHLQKNGVSVRVGQIVKQRQVIGRSGNTGYSSGPHLHFEVVSLEHDLDYTSIPVAFRTREKRLQLLKEGKDYTAW
jgi:murein DD-endopeptidase MepM/ murein hydrolase activator NlpD